MYQLFGLALMILTPPALFAVPFVLRLPRVRLLLNQLAKRLPRRAPKHVGFQPLDSKKLPTPNERQARQKSFIQGGFLAAFSILCMASLGAFPDDTSRDFTQLRNSVLFAVFGGLGLLAASEQFREARLSQRCTRVFDILGLRGTWSEPGAGREQPLSFRKRVLEEVARHRSLQMLGSDGLTLFRALSHPAHKPLEVPHPALAGAKIQLLLVPPRSKAVDPERKRCSCAEEALARIKVSPEHHWRDLQHALEIRNRWTTQYDLHIDVRFVEERPLFHMLHSGRRAWFRPWASSGEQWIETQGGSKRDQMHDIVHDAFVHAWARANRELCFSLTAGPTGSTYIRKGVEAGVEETKLVIQP